MPRGCEVKASASLLVDLEKGHLLSRLNIPNVYSGWGQHKLDTQFMAPLYSVVSAVSLRHPGSVAPWRVRGKMSPLLR